MIYIGIALAAFGADASLKRYMNNRYGQGQQGERLGGRLILHLCHNHDGAFGLFARCRDLGKKLSGTVLLGILVRFISILRAGASPLSKLGLALVAGGGSSNFHERCTKGYVTDYFSFGVKNQKIRSTVFNLSDFMILGGMLLYLAGREKH